MYDARIPAANLEAAIRSLAYQLTSDPPSYQERNGGKFGRLLNMLSKLAMQSSKPQLLNLTQELYRAANDTDRSRYAPALRRLLAVAL